MDSFILKFPPDTQFSDDEFFEFCAANDARLSGEEVLPGFELNLSKLL